MKEVINKTIDRKILLNPGPATTSARVKQALICEDICPREEEFGNLVVSIKEKIKKIVNADCYYEGILLGCSGTGAIESCLSSCVDTDDTILIIENGAYGKRMAQICDTLDIHFESLKFEWGQCIEWLEVEKHLASSAQKFNVIAFVHHETTTGILNSLSDFNKIAKKHHLVSIVDAMSSYAGIKIDLKEDSVDYLISSSNKCIQGMAGIGIVIAKTLELVRIKNFKKKSFYFDLYKNYSSQKNNGEFLFTPPVQTLYALNEALDEFFDEGGIENRSNRYSNLFKIMFEGMRKIGFRPLLNEKDQSKILTTFFEPEDKNYTFKGMHAYLLEKGITIYPGKVDQEKTFRISNLGELSEQDIQLFLQSISKYIDDTGVVLG